MPGCSPELCRRGLKRRWRLRPGLDCLFCALNGHDALYDKRLACVVDDLTHLVNALRACVGAELFEEGQTRSVNVHRNGEHVVSLHIVELFKDDLLVPWLYRRDADAADLAHFVNGVGNKLGKLAVAGHGAYAVVCRRVYKHAVVCDIVVLIAVVQGQSAERSDEYGGGELFAEQLKGRVHVGVGIERVHVDEYLLPLVVVARGGVAGQLAARDRGRSCRMLCRCTRGMPCSTVP